MNCQDINNMINAYFDNELSTEQESFLFTHLAQCELCKTNFKALNRVHHEFHKEESEFPNQLEQRIFSTIKQRGSHFPTNSPTKRLPNYFIYGYGLLLTIFSVFMTYQFYNLQKETLNYKDNFEMTVEKINTQQKQISALINEMPAVKVNASVDNPDLLIHGI